MAGILWGIFAFALREGFPKVPREAYLGMGKGFFLDDTIWFVGSMA